MVHHGSGSLLDIVDVIIEHRTRELYEQFERLLEMFHGTDFPELPESLIAGGSSPAFVLDCSPNLRRTLQNRGIGTEAGIALSSLQSPYHKARTEGARRPSCRPAG